MRIRKVTFRTIKKSHSEERRLFYWGISVIVELEALLQNQTIKCRAVKVQCLALGTPDGAVVRMEAIPCDFVDLVYKGGNPAPPCRLTVEVAKEKNSLKRAKMVFLDQKYLFLAHPHIRIFGLFGYPYNPIHYAVFQCNFIRICAYKCA